MQKNNSYESGNTTLVIPHSHSTSKEEALMWLIAIVIAVGFFVALYGISYLMNHENNVKAKMVIANELGLECDAETIDKAMIVYRGDIGYWGEDTYSLTVYYEGEKIYFYAPYGKGTDEYNQVIDEQTTQIDGILPFGLAL